MTLWTSAKNSRTIWQRPFILGLLFACLNGSLSLWYYQKQLQQRQEQLHQEVTLVTQFLRSALQRGQYQNARQILKLWSQTRHEVSSLKAIAENGYTFFTYERSHQFTETVLITKTLHYGYQGQLDLQITFKFDLTTPTLIFSFWLSLGLLAALGLIALTWSGTLYRKKNRLEKQSVQTQHFNELQDSHQQLEDFAYIISHDLKEPLRKLHQCSIFLNEEYTHQLQGRGLTCLENIQTHSGRMDTLVDSLLHYSQLGNIPLQHENIPLNALITNIHTSLSQDFLQEHVTLRIPQPLPSIEGDLITVENIFRNLLKNAFQYNDKPTPWIEVGYQTPSDSLIFYIRDNGIGIPVSQHKTIFQIFRRVSSQAHTASGSGTGLTMLKRIIDRLHGKLWLDSIPNEGCTFYFTLSPETTPQNWPEAIIPFPAESI
jgi:signal transduction histidine kinase